MERITTEKVEKSVLYYLIICEGLSEYLEKMFIDEKRIFALTKYSKKGQSYNKVRDHNVVIGRLKFKFQE